MMLGEELLEEDGPVKRGEQGKGIVYYIAYDISYDIAS